MKPATKTTPAERPVPRRGQIWKAASPKTRSGFRYVRIDRVYRPDLALHTATVREVSKAGKDLKPDYVHDGVEVSTSFDIGLGSDGLMPSGYSFRQ